MGGTQRAVAIANTKTREVVAQRPLLDAICLDTGEVGGAGGGPKL